jgi:ABC-type Fe3+ transport system permease subunit
MYIKNVLIGTAAVLICLVGLLLLVQPSRRQPVHLGIIERMIRAFLAGLGFMISAISGTAAVNYLGSPRLEKDWNIGTLAALSCFALPIGLLTIIGVYYWYSRQDATQQFFSRRLNEIIRKSKKER